MERYLDGIKVGYTGAVTTLSITAVAVIIGVALGLVVALLKMSNKKPLRIIASCYIDALRGTPLLIQALILYFGLPQILQAAGVNFVWSSAYIPGVLACGINSSAYVGEIIRAGLQAVDNGQSEAARSLGMTYGQSMRFVIIPQAFKIIIPALGNEFITLIKETAVLSVITVTDITRASMLLASRTFDSWPAYIGAAVVYMTLTIPLSKIMNYVERKMSNDDKS